MKDQTAQASLDTLRHSAAHLMARAVMRLFPNVQLAFGPNVENGFYYDFTMEHRLTEEDFPTWNEYDDFCYRR